MKTRMQQRLRAQMRTLPTYEEVSDTEHIYMASDDSTGYQEKSEEEYFADVNKDHNFSMRSAMTEK